MARAVEVVTANETLKDGKSVKQMLIDTYAENQKAIEGKRPQITIGEDEREAVHDIKKGPKYSTSFHAQMLVMAMRAFKQRRGDILNWMQTFTIVAIAILSGLLWFQMDKKGTASLCSFFCPKHTVRLASPCRRDSPLFHQCHNRERLGR
jgi:hypothetical protein